MATPLDPAFKLSEYHPEEIEEIIICMEHAFGNDELWVATLKDVPKDVAHAWFMKDLAPRWLLPDITIYKITEISTGRIAGWTALQFPWKDRPLADEAKAMVTSHDLPASPEGTNLEALVEFFTMLSFADRHGYDPEVDYHRKGTMIHPDFQKRRFGTILTQHCNAISDSTGGRTFVPARPTSIKMFNQNGFTTVGSVDHHLERWGLSREKSVTWMCVREAPAS